MGLSLRSERRAAAVAFAYAAALLLVFYLFLPSGGYTRIVEGKYACFLLLGGGFAAAAALTFPIGTGRPVSPLLPCAAAYLACSALSALLSPYGAVVILGGPRREGLLTLALCVLSFCLLARALRPDRRLLYAAAAAVTLCDLLALVQTLGFDPFDLYPGALTYLDGDRAYPGFYAGVSGNVDFTAFLLALAACALAAALVRRRLWLLAPPLALTLFTLEQLGVAAAWLGLACAAVWSPALLFPRRRRLCLSLSAALSLAALGFLFFYSGAQPTLAELSRLLHGDTDPAFGSGRLAIWRQLPALVRERPLLGGGPDTLVLRGLIDFTWQRPDGVAVRSVITSAHNEYLNILVNQGALALASYLALLLTALVRCFRRAAEARFAVCGAALLCYGAMALVSVSSCVTAPYVWLLLALIACD